MKTFLRGALALLAGLILGSIVNMALVTLGPKLIPPPAGMDMSDAKSWSASAHLLEPKHFLFPFLAHALGTLVGAATAFLLASKYRVVLAYVVGVFFLAGGIAAASMIPAPRWFVVSDLLLAYIPLAWLGAFLAQRISFQAAPTLSMRRVL